MKSRFKLSATLVLLLFMSNLYSQERNTTIEFNGVTWDVMDFGGYRHGPGNNLWKENFVTKESDGLHMKVGAFGWNQRGGEISTNAGYACSQIQFPVNAITGDGYAEYGEYSVKFKVLSPDFPDYLVFSPFIWQNSGGILHEVDIEFSRWDSAGMDNTQYSIHYGASNTTPEWGNNYDFETDIENNDYHLAKFNWQPDYIEFEVGSFNGQTYTVIDQTTFDENSVPFDENWLPKEADNMMFIINFWFCCDERPNDTQASWEIVITDIDCPMCSQGGISNEKKSSETVFPNNSNESIKSFKVSQNQPNPFTGETGIEVETPSAKNVSVIITDITGKEVYAKDAGTINGTQNITLTSDNMDAGIYFYTVKIGEESVTKKMIVK